jgi:hypothetical protein
VEKNLEGLAWLSSFKSKKRDLLSSVQLILEHFEVKKYLFFENRSLRCCHAPLKINKYKSLYLKNPKR